MSHGVDTRVLVLFCFEAGWLCAPSVAEDDLEQIFSPLSL